MEKEIQKKQWSIPEIALIGSDLIESGSVSSRPEGSYFFLSGTVRHGSDS
ncbi:MAG: hypothetical protein ACXVJD_09710 [Mucilaginibacter sp.]